MFSFNRINKTTHVTAGNLLAKNLSTSVINEPIKKRIVLRAVHTIGGKKLRAEHAAKIEHRIMGPK